MSTKFLNLKQEISNTPEIDEAVSEKGIKDYADTTALHYISPATTAGSSSSPYLSVKWNVESVDGVTTPTDGMRLAARVNRVGVSTAGIALSIDNGTTYYPVVYNVNTTLTTHFTVNSSIVLVFNATQTASQYITAGTKVTVTGCWQVLCNYDTNTVTQLRHASGSYIAKEAVKRYKILLQYDETTLLPISSGSSTSGHTYDTTNEFNPFGQILYVNSSTVDYVAAGGTIAAGVLTQQQSSIDMRYTFNGGTTMVTTNKDVYLVATPQTNGRAKLDSTPIAQTLPSTEDGKIYIYLGHAQSAYQLEIHPTHPIYYYKDGAIREWTNPEASGEITTVTMDGVLSDQDIAISNVSHTWTQISALLSQGKPVEVLLTMDGNEYRLRYVNYDNQFESVIDELDVSVWYDEGDEEWYGWLSYLTALNFDGTSTTQYLSKAGWFEPLPTYTDEKVKQIKVDGENHNFPIIMTSRPVDQSFSERTDITLLTPNIYINPYSETLSAPYFSGDGRLLTHVPVDSHEHGKITNDGKIPTTIQSTDVTPATNDKIVITDNSDDDRVVRSSIAATDVVDAVSKKHSHSNITLSTTAQAYDGSHTIAMPSSDPYTSARTPSSHTHGNISNTGTLTDTADAPANGDKIVIRDASDNKVQSSNIAFDGSTTNKYLSPKGTWETLPETPVCQTAQTTAVSGDTYTASITGFTSTLTNFRFALVLKQAPGTQSNIKININSTGAQYVKYWNADGQSVSLLGGSSVQQGDVLDITYGASSGLTLIAIKRGGTNVVSGSVTSVQVQATSPVQSSQSTAQTGTLNTTISLASGYGDTQNPYGSKTANQVLAAPNGSNGNPSFRSLVAADIPALGNIQNSGALQTNDITIANGDKLVVTDSSDSNKVARTSVAFDGSTTTQYLSKKGTWEDVPADVIVTMDLTQSSSSGSAISYTVSNASHTPTQVVSLISSGKNVKIAANIDGVAFNLDCTHNDSNGLVFSCATVTLALMMYLVVGDTTIDSWVGLSGGLAEYEHHHGYISSTGTMTDTVAPVVNGDAIIVRGGSSNIVGTSDITFDGSTTNQVLSKKGTWVTLPTNTDILVKQTSDTTSTSEFPLLASAQSSPTSGTAYEAKYNANIKIKPSNGTLTATNLVGDGMNIGGIVSFCSCTTAAATAAKQLTVNGTNGSGWTLSAGKIIALSSCTYSNTATNVTLNVNNTGAHSIYYDNAVYSGSDPFITGSEGGRTAYYMYDGTYWVWMGRVHGGVEMQYDNSGAVYPILCTPLGTSSTSTSFNSLRYNGLINADLRKGILYATKFAGEFDGASSKSAVAIANNDALLIADASDSSKIKPSTTKFGTSTTTFLRNDGQWATPAGGGGDTGYTSSSLSNNTSTITFGNTKEYQRVIVTGSTQTFNLSVGNNCTNYLLVTNSGSNDCVVAIGVQSGTSITTIAKPSGGITVPSGKTIELSFIKIASASAMGEYTLVVTASEEMSIVSV